MTRLRGRRAASILAAGAVCLAALAVAAGPARAATPGLAAPAPAGPDAPAGSNLLVNPGAMTGAVSQQGWDAVTIPGWQVRQGLPTVVRYGTPGFPGRADAGTQGRGQRLFASGPAARRCWPSRSRCGPGPGGPCRPGPGSGSRDGSAAPW